MVVFLSSPQSLHRIKPQVKRHFSTRKTGSPSSELGRCKCSPKPVFRPGERCRSFRPCVPRCFGTHRPIRYNPAESKKLEDNEIPARTQQGACFDRSQWSEPFHIRPEGIGSCVLHDTGRSYNRARGACRSGQVSPHAHIGGFRTDPLERLRII